MKMVNNPCALALIALLVVLPQLAAATTVGSWLYSLAAADPANGNGVSTLTAGNSDTPPSTNVGINAGTSHSEVSFNQNSAHTITGFQGIAQIPATPAFFVPVTVSSSNLDYSFTVIAPDGSPVSNVPIILSGLVEVASNGAAVSDVSVDVRYGGNILAITGYQCITATGLSCMNSYTASLATTVSAFSASQAAGNSNLNSGYVELDGSANVYGDFVPGGAATESAAYAMDSLTQPYISIDPTFLAANPGYIVEVSAGIVNSVPTPEPAVSQLVVVAALMGIAMAGLQKITKLSQRDGIIFRLLHQSACPGELS